MSQYVQLVLKVTPQAREKLRKFAKEDGRVLSRQFEHLMEQEDARRLERFNPEVRAATTQLTYRGHMDPQDN